MSSKEELTRLESQIEGLSKQLGATQELLFKLHKNLIEVSGHMVQWIEERRKDAEKKEKKFEILIYYRSLIMGLVLGIFGNMFVSYLMKALDIFQISSEGWLLTTFVALGGVLALIRLFYTEIKKVSKEISSS